MKIILKILSSGKGGRGAPGRINHHREKSFMENGVLEDCATSKGFDKRLQATVKKLEGRLAKYQAGTPPALALAIYKKSICKKIARFVRNLVQIKQSAKY